MARMQVYLPDDLYEQVKARDLPARSCSRKPSVRSCVGWSCSPRPITTLRPWSPRSGLPPRRSAPARPASHGGLRDALDALAQHAHDVSVEKVWRR